jgi:hypothetical protein
MIEQYFKSRNMTMTEVKIKNEQTSGKWKTKELKTK